MTSGNVNHISTCVQVAKCVFRYSNLSSEIWQIIRAFSSIYTGLKVQLKSHQVHQVKSACQVNVYKRGLVGLSIKLSPCVHIERIKHTLISND